MHVQSHNSNSPIYVSTNQQASGLPNSVSNNSVYNSQQQQQPPPSTVYAPSNGLPNNGNYPTAAAAQTSAPIPQAPPFPMVAMSNGGPPMPPAMPIVPAIGGAAPPPPPPPMSGLLNQSIGMDMSSLASQLQQAKLKRNAKNSPPPLPAENSGSSTSSGGSGNYGTIGRTSGNGMASMMDEMAKTLARRREKAEKKPEVKLEILLTGDYHFNIAFDHRNKMTIMDDNDRGRNQTLYHTN